MNRVILTLLVAAATPLAVRAQRADSMQAMMGAMEAMDGDHMAHMKHMTWSPLKPMTARDSLRATAIADTLRRAIAKYADTAAAVRDGYAMFMPQAKHQATYHFTRNASALKAAFVFDPSSPTSLLYTRDASGHLKLIGAMYTAPARFTAAQLDARVPTSVAQWHQHVNLCIPRNPNDLERLRSGAPDSLFGLTGSIADRATCETDGGRFIERIFGWMVHVYPVGRSGLHDMFETAATHQ